ncbi:MAG: helix-turn-helix domain-containing protein [Prevotella sp.]
MKGLKDGFQGERQVVLPPMVIETERADRLASSLYVTDIGYYPSASRHYRERLTPIGQFVLIYCVDGSGWYATEDKEYRVKAGEFFILPPDVPHSYGATPNGCWTIYWIHFSGQHAAIYAEGMQTPRKINVAVNSRIMDRICIFEEILTTLQSGTSIEHLRYASSLLHHFLASMRYLVQFREASGNNRLSHADAPVSEQDLCQCAIHFMQENIENRMTLQQAATYIGYSQSHFSALFRKQTGMSPHAYYNRLKMEHACRLLKETGLKVNQICHKLGIDDQYYFSRLFSKTIGMSPTQYRQSLTSPVLTMRKQEDK